jgi:hypothetical protein
LLADKAAKDSMLFLQYSPDGWTSGAGKMGIDDGPSSDEPRLAATLPLSPPPPTALSLGNVLQVFC